MKALVTGGAGFIGSHVGQRLLDEGWEVVVLDDLSSGFEQNIPSRAHFVRGSFCDVQLLSKVLPGCSAVLHLAATSSVVESIDQPLPVHENNLTGTLALLEECVEHGVRRFVFSSSAAVYGDAGNGAIREDAPKAPVSHYAVQKLAGEHYCGIYLRLHGLETVCLRYFNVYGPRQNADSPYTGVITKFLAAGREGKPLVIYGDGLQSRDFVHVDDVAAANVSMVLADRSVVAGRAFNVGSGRAVSVSEIAAMVRRRFPTASESIHLEMRPGEIRHSLANIDLASQSFGFRPQQRIAEFISGNT